ncbi:MAG: SGNH/GDSL hydrolase family protein, partial [Bacillota bacterium]|nr:SGNH/GDSL hydrolase family protein [Bacillota bacterium]
ITSRTGEAGLALKGGTIVTVCIGANNLLGPVINAVANAYGLDSSAPDFLTTLQGKIAANPAQWNTVLTQLYFSALFGQLHQDLDKGVADFNADWPLIINGIKNKAPGAQILALTIYDPLPMDNQFYNILNPLIVSINKTITSQAVKSGYKVADIYTDFKLSTESPVSFDINAGNFDPHPNDLGHEIIFEDLKTKVKLPR